MSKAAGDGGGGSHDLDFNPDSDDYDPGTVHGGGSGSASDGGLDANSAFESGLKDVLLAPGLNIASGFLGDGVYDKVSSAMQSSNPEQLTQLASTWSTIANRTIGYCMDLTLTVEKIGASWSGDDADKALAVLKGIHVTLSSQYSKSSNMSTALQNMGSNMKQMKDSFHSESTTSTIKNSFTGSDDRKAESSYKQLMESMKADLHIMPETVPKQLKADGAGNSPSLTPPPPHAGGPGGAPSVGGPGSAAHIGNPANPRIAAPTPVDPNPTQPDPDQPNIDNPQIDNPSLNNPDGTDYPGVDSSSPYSGGGPAFGGSPALDTSGSLAGYDGAGGAGSLGGGAGVGELASGGGAGAGAGLGGGAGGGLGAGAGAGGLGSGAGGGGGGAPGGGAGGRGMMPMHGGQNNDDDERERTTWLNEDDDVWGAEDNLPGVIH